MNNNNFLIQNKDENIYQLQIENLKKQKKSNKFNSN